MSEQIGARRIAESLTRIMGQYVSQWQVYRLSRRAQSPIGRDPEGVMLCATDTELHEWWQTSAYAPIFAKQVDRRRNRRQARAKSDLRLFGVIGDGDLTDTAVLKAIDDLGSPKSIRVLINSDGGLVSHGLAMYHALRQHQASIGVEIVGVAASMASAIAMAGDKVSMAEDGLFMLHDPWAGAAGNADDLRSAADMLDKHSESLAAIYARKSGIEETEVREMMNKDGGAGTYLNSKEALEFGFVDEILEAANAKLPELPAAALAKRIVKGGGPMKVKPNRKGQGNASKTFLASILSAAIASLVDDDNSEEDVLGQVADAGELKVEDVQKILDGESEPVSEGTIKAFADLLDVESEMLISAAKKDGWKFEDPPKPSNRPKPQSRRTGNVSEVQEAVRQELQAQARVRRDALARARKLGMPDAAAAEIATECTDLDDANNKILAWLTDPKNQRRIDGINGAVTLDADERDKWLDGMGRWLIVKSGHARMVEKHLKDSTGEAKRLDPGEFRGFRLLDIARDVLERDGVNVRGMSPREIAKRVTAPRADQAGLGTRSDFPILLENVLHKMLQAAYETAADQWRMVAGVGSVSDFREHPRLRLGQISRLDKLLESGEFKNLHFPDAEKESIKADTFGNLIGLTRQAIVNDDVDGFSRMTVMLGRAASRSIEIDVFALFGLNSGLGPDLRDGNPLFDASHNNIDGSAAAPSVSSIEAGRVLMAQQKDPSDEDFLNLRPDVWVGPIGLGSVARTAIMSEFDFDAETSGNTGKFMKPNVVRDLLSTIVDTPRLTSTRWYLLADPAIAPVIEVVFLEGQESPVIEAEEGFDFDGVRWRVRHDYGTGATDHRGTTTNAGA